MRRLIGFLDRTFFSLDLRHFRIFPKLLPSATPFSNFNLHQPPSSATFIFTIFADKVDYIAFTSPRARQDYDSHNLLVDTKIKMDYRHAQVPGTWLST
jgi:hypothetical protein